jgi:2-polyprenyl-3-methyl-5-hydroxy-6-metoxy-1,4-benzoquinol methylase
MIAVTIGVGEKYKRYAEKSAEMVRDLLGMETRIISDEHLSYAVEGGEMKDKVYSLKFKIFDIYPDIDRVMYFDCDWRPVKKFSLQEFTPNESELYFVVDRIENDHVKGLEKRYKLNKGTYFNAGWFVASREHKPLFDFCNDNYWKYDKVWFDQCVMNQVFQNKVTYADRRLNIMNIDGREALGIHTSGNYHLYDNMEKISDWDFSHNYITAKMHIEEIHEIAKNYNGLEALEVGTFRAHASKAMAMAGMAVKTIDTSDHNLQSNIRFCDPYPVQFEIMSGEDELKINKKYDVVFHDSYHGEVVVPELVKYYNTKVKKGGVLIVHDVDSFNVPNFLNLIGNPKHTITTDEIGRQLGAFYLE